MDSILVSVKKVLGIDEDCESFDKDILFYINTVFSILMQMGIGPPEGFTITDKTFTWKDFFKDSPEEQFIKTYICLRVKKLFDPTASSSIASTIDETLSELEYRMIVYISDNNDSEVIS